MRAHGDPPPHDRAVTQLQPRERGGAGADERTGADLDEVSVAAELKRRERRAVADAQPEVAVGGDDRAAPQRQRRAEQGAAQQPVGGPARRRLRRRRPAAAGRHVTDQQALRGDAESEVEGGQGLQRDRGGGDERQVVEEERGGRERERRHAQHVEGTQRQQHRALQPRRRSHHPVGARALGALGGARRRPSQYALGGTV